MMEAVSENLNEVPPRTLKPINLSNIVSSSQAHLHKHDSMIRCLLCEEEFPATESGVNNPILPHLMIQHQLVIADVQNIAQFPKYIRYWTERLQGVNNITDIFVMVNSDKTNPETGKENPTDNQLYLLTDFLPEDFSLRSRLSREKLTSILDGHISDRVDPTFDRKCLFCKEQFTGERSAMFRHMALNHSFNIGNPDNIINANEFLDILQVSLDNFQCLFCENVFKDWVTLKEHMRKKGHKRINPKNVEYDRFYLINYLDPGKNWKDMQLDPEYEFEEQQVEKDRIQELDWSDWTDTEGDALSVCLFCPFTARNIHDVFNHMKEEHDFDLCAMGLEFYEQVKMVNYIRRQVYMNKCPYCLEQFEDRLSLQSHLQSHKHYRLPEDERLWNIDEYFYPTLEDDTMLCYLQDIDEDE